MSDKKVKVGLVGCGNAGRGIHMVQFAKHQDLYQVVCCADAVPESAATLAKDLLHRAKSGRAVGQPPAPRNCLDGVWSGFFP